MATNEIISKLNELSELRKMAEDLNAEIEAIQEAIKAHMTEADADTLKVWKMKNAPDEEAEEAEMLSLYGSGNLGAITREPDRRFGHDHVVEDMILAVRDGRDPEVLPAEALKAVKIVCAVYESARTGKTVQFE